MRAQETASGLPDAQLMKSGEFASLCRTTKDTLRHYRQIGLLEPAFVSESGYAQYSPLQLGDFLLIASLQKAGSSLEAIRSYLADPQEEALDAILEAHIDQLKEERRSLLARQRFLEGTLARRRSLGSWARCAQDWRVVEVGEEFFSEVDVSGLFVEGDLDAAQEQELTERLVDQGVTYLAQEVTNEMQGSYRVGLRALEAGHPESDFHLCMRLPTAKRRRADHVKPKGIYFQRLRAASIDAMLADEESLFSAYSALYDEAIERGLSPIGDLYEQELSLYTGDIAATVYTELSIQVAAPQDWQVKGGGLS